MSTEPLQHPTYDQEMETLFSKSQHHIPGGVNSPVRAFKGVGGTPIFIREASGARIIATTGRSYIDYVGSWGPMILGHAHPQVVEAVRNAAVHGLSFGAPTELETQMADTVCSILPSMDQVRMVNSGTEATMSAIRLARGATGRDKILKFEGCYHGHADSLLVKAGSGALTLGVPSSPGVPEAIARETLTLPYNDIEAVTELMNRIGSEIACIIVEPVAGNMNCVPPVPGFLEHLRKVCDQFGTLLIFDEVMTGFRVALGGAQALYNVTPDLTTLGKIIGGGLPVGAFGGKRELMTQLAPLGPVYQAGTLSGNPLAMSAGLATLKLIATPGFHEHLSAQTARLTHELEAAAKEAGIALRTNQVGAMFGLFFTDQPAVRNFADVMRCSTDQFRRFFHGMLDQGVYFAPSAFEAAFMSSAHGDEEIELTIKAAKHTFAHMEKAQA